MKQPIKIKCEGSSFKAGQRGNAFYVAHCRSIMTGVCVHGARLIQVVVGRLGMVYDVEQEGYRGFGYPQIRESETVQVQFDVPLSHDGRDIWVLIDIEELDGSEGARYRLGDSPTITRCRACGGAIGLFDHDGNPAKYQGMYGPHVCAYVCEVCGHEPCPCCGNWCDKLQDPDDDQCCNGHCKLVLKKPIGFATPEEMADSMAKRKAGET
jgi:hypothetical protein